MLEGERENVENLYRGTFQRKLKQSETGAGKSKTFFFGLSFKSTRTANSGSDKCFEMPQKWPII